MGNANSNLSHETKNFVACNAHVSLFKAKDTTHVLPLPTSGVQNLNSQSTCSVTDLSGYLTGNFHTCLFFLIN